MESTKFSVSKRFYVPQIFVGPIKFRVQNKIKFEKKIRIQKEFDSFQTHLEMAQPTPHTPSSHQPDTQKTPSEI